MVFLYILLAILILLVMVTIHELGHYIAAKILKIRVAEFSIGFGPKIFGFTKKNGEKFTLRLFPLGGYCAFPTDEDEKKLTNNEDTLTNNEERITNNEGEKLTKNEERITNNEDTLTNNEERITNNEGKKKRKGRRENKENKKTFFQEKPWKRIIVLFSGGLLNFLSAIIFSFIFLLAVGQPSANAIAVHSIARDENNVAISQLQRGDVITHVDGQRIDATRSFYQQTNHIEAGGVVDFTIIRDGSTQNLTLTRSWVASPVFEGLGFWYRSSGGEAVVEGVAIMAGGDKYLPLYEGDRIFSVNGNALSSRERLSSMVAGARLGDRLTLGVRRVVENETVELEVEALKRMVQPNALGFGFFQTVHYQRESFLGALLHSVPFTARLSWSVLGAFGGLFTGRTPVTDLTGPVGTVSQMASVTQDNWRNILLLLPLIASNLAIFNLLPFPALDGSKIIFTSIEAIRKKPIKRKIENTIHIVGLFVLLGLVIALDITGFVLRGRGLTDGILRV